MKSSNTRRPLHQQIVPEQKGPFFSKANDDAKKKDDVFFQTKLAVGEPGDKHEQEADKVADKVQKKAEEKEKPEVQKKGEDKDKESDKSATAPAPDPKSVAAPGAPQKDKIPNDKDIAGSTKHGKDQAPDAQQKDKVPGKGAAGPMASKDEEPKMVSRKEVEHEEKPVQKMSEGDKKEEDKTKINKKEEQGKQEKDEQVMRKETGGSTHAAHKVSIEERIKQSKGKGQTLPDDVRAFLESQLGADFGEVVIHTDNEAVAMSKELNARAFTSGFDIFFNAGQYNPGTVEGQKLLAHELTHVIQQTGVSKKKDKK
jgi:hypothetical protein